MRLSHIFKTSFKALYTHKARSALTILGIVIGITAIILIMAVGYGAENLILGQLSGMGAEIIVVRPGREPKGPSDFAEALFSDSLKDRDVAALKNKSNVPGLQAVAPAVIVPGSASYMGETYKPTIFGWTAQMMEDLFDIKASEGLFFDDADIRQKASVAIIGAKVKKELFGNSDALGKNIKIKNRNFKVVAVLESRGQVSFFNVDEIVLLPYTTAASYLLGVDYYHEIIVKAETPEAVARTVRDIEITLREMHNITDPEKDDFYVETQQGLVNQVKIITGVLTLFLTAVVSISLVVGGIGIMNIMLVSVTERTREIGLRKSLGATEKDIMTQFLLEAVTLTTTGGAIGVALGAILSFLMSVILTQVAGLDWGFSFPIIAVILGFGVSAGVGLVFGLYPAKKASEKSPIEALRYE
jgi:putative ABC transport system permease protein